MNTAPVKRPPLPHPLLTLADGPGAAGLGQAVALAHGAAEADVHEALRGGGEGRAPRQQHPHPAAQQGTHLPEYQAGWREGGRERRHGEGGQAIERK